MMDMKYALLFFTGLLLMGCGAMRSSGQLRKLKLDQAPKKEVVHEEQIRDWDAIIEDKTEEPKFIHLGRAPQEPTEIIDADDANEAVESGVDYRVIEETAVTESEHTIERYSGKSALGGAFIKSKRINGRQEMQSWLVNLLVILGIILICATVVLLIVFVPTVGYIVVWTIVGAIVLGLAFLIGALIWWAAS